MLQVSLFDQSVFSKSTTSTAHNYTHSSNNTKKVTELDMPLREQEEIILSWKQQVKSFILQRIKFRTRMKMHVPLPPCYFSQSSEQSTAA